MDRKKSRLGGFAAIAVIVSYLLPWTNQAGNPILLSMWFALRDGYFFTGLLPAFDFLSFVLILGLAGYVVVVGLVRGSCQWKLVSGLGAILLLNNLFYVFLNLYYGNGFGVGFGIGLNYIATFSLIMLAFWGARDSARGVAWFWGGKFCRPRVFRQLRIRNGDRATGSWV